MKATKKVQTHKPKVQQITQMGKNQPILNKKPKQQTLPNQQQPIPLLKSDQKIKYVAQDQNEEQIPFEQEQNERIQVIYKVNSFEKEDSSHYFKYYKAFNNTIIRSRQQLIISHETQTGQIIATLDLKQVGTVNFQINMGSEKIVLIRFFHRQAFGDVSQWSWNLETLEVVKAEKSEQFQPFSIPNFYPQIPIIVFQKTSMFCVYEKRKGKQQKILNYYKIPLQAQNNKPLYSIKIPSSLAQFSLEKVNNSESFFAFNPSDNDDQAKFYIINPKNEQNIKQFTFRYNNNWKKKYFKLELKTVWEAAPGLFYLKIYKKIGQFALKQIPRQEYRTKLEFLESRQRYFHILWNSQTKEHRVIRIIEEPEQNYEIQFTTGLRNISTLDHIHVYNYYPLKMQKPRLPDYYSKSVFYVQLKTNLIVASQIRGFKVHYQEYKQNYQRTVRFVQLNPMPYCCSVLYVDLILSLFQFDDDLVCEAMALFKITNSMVKKGWTALNNEQWINDQSKSIVLEII